MWSTWVGAMRSTTEHLGPTGGAAVLCSLAGLFLYLFSRRTPVRQLPRAYLWLGGGLFVAYELCVALALGLARNRSEAIEIGMVNYLWPSLTVVFAAIAGRQRITLLMAAGLVLALAGVVAAASPAEGLSFSRFFENAAGNPISYGLVVAGAICWALYCICTRHLAQGKDGLWFFMTLAAMAFWFLHIFQTQAPWVPAGITGSVVLQVVLTSAAITSGYALWNVGILRGNINVLAFAANGTPLVSALFASFLLSTPLTWMFWIGAGLVAAGSAIGSLGAKQSQAA